MILKAITGHLKICLSSLVGFIFSKEEKMKPCWKTGEFHTLVAKWIFFEKNEDVENLDAKLPNPKSSQIAISK